MKLFLLFVLALTVIARESLLSSILEDLLEERLADAGVGDPKNGYLACDEPVTSLQGPGYPTGCAGAVWHADKSPAERYCKGDRQITLASLDVPEYKYPWYPKCCYWNGSSCVDRPVPGYG